MRVDGGIKLFETELEHRLDKLVKLFAYIHDKDIFLEFYRKQLAKRLLTSKSASERAEQQFISQLKLRCGAQFTSKLEGMIKDIGRSRDHELQFTRYLSAQKKKTPFQYEFNCKVLTSGFWPHFGGSNSGGINGIMLPRSMKKVIDYFEGYFKSLHEKRLLRWVHDLGTVELIGHFDAKSVVLQVSTLQCCILLILNQIASIKIVDMTRMLGVDPIQIKKQLKPLCSRKFHILNKAPTKGHDVKHGQVWWTNSRCIRPLRDCTTPSITQKNDDQMLSTKIASFCTMYRAPSTSTVDASNKTGYNASCLELPRRQSTGSLMVPLHKDFIAMIIPKLASTVESVKSSSSINIPSTSTLNPSTAPLTVSVYPPTAVLKRGGDPVWNMQ